MRMFAIAATVATSLIIAMPVLAQENSATKAAAQSAEKQPARETEVMLRKHIEGMRIGKPVYDLMTPTIAAAVQPYEAIGKTRFAQLGAIRSVEFRGMTSEGADTYFVQYENGATDYLIALTDDGKIRALVLRPNQ
jgi:hypothetical protein